MAQRSDIFAWVDLEMTGLDPDNCKIVQIALLLTDGELNQIAPPLDLVIWQPPAVLDSMGPFVRKMHTHSGLLDKIKCAKLDTADAEKKVMECLTKHCEYGTAHLAGNSIGQDRRFLRHFMPSVDTYLHYRMVDVTSVKLLCSAWYGKKVNFEKPKDGQHTALVDIQNSIAELKYYKEQAFRS